MKFGTIYLTKNNETNSQYVKENLVPIENLKRKKKKKQ